jgi:hypothetical protein
MNAIVPTGGGFSLPPINLKNGVLAGDLIKFTDNRGWHLRNNPRERLDGRQYWTRGTATFLQRWQDGKPDTIVDYPLPDVDDLNAAIPEAEWELGLDGKRRAPWAVYFAAYLLEPLSARNLTYVNCTWGAQQAVEGLAESIANMRALRGAMVHPLVELASIMMPSKQYGPRPRPDFKIIQWRDFSQGETATASTPKAAALPASEPEPPPGKPVKPVSFKEFYDDDIPF